ncbi:MAG: hypothetical protein RLY20_1652 [Verrucomicrobiota bacterium]|jgi:signal transduction histidine kinase
MGKLRAAILLSFRSKLLLPVLLIMAALVAAITWVVTDRVTAQAEADARRTLDTADAVFKKSQEIRANNLLNRFRGRRGEPRYKATFQTRHAETVRQFLFQEINFEQGVDVMTFTVDDGDMLAAATRSGLNLPLGDFQTDGDSAISEALAGREHVDTIIVGDRLMDVVAIPVMGVGDDLLGALAIGSEVGDHVAQELSAQTKCEVVFIAHGKIAGSSLSTLTVQSQGGALAALAAQLIHNQSQGDLTRVELGSTPYFARLGHFQSAPGRGDISYLVLNSCEVPLQTLRQTRSAIFLVSVIGILLGGVVVWYFVRRVVEPLERLRDSVEAVGRGDLSARVEVSTHDECGDLAIVFNRMVGNLQASRLELEQALEKLRTTQSQLVQSEKLSGIGEFVAGVAHELNNPLTTVMGFSEMLHKSCTDERERKKLDLVHKSAKRCHKIVQNLLSFARQRPPERKAVDVNRLLQASAEFLEYQMRTSNVKVQFDCAPGLPTTHADPHQLQQVFINLMNNARQAIEAHQPSGVIRVSTALDDGVIRIVFHDSGPGISRENLSKIFNPFFTTKEVGKGTGLGLSLCYGIVREHGGQIEVASELGDGAKFTIELPANGAHVAAEIDTKFIRPAEEVAFGNGRRVLIIDDEEGILEMLGELLKSLGFEVDSAKDGETGLQRTVGNRYEAVFCDWKMPGISGQQVYEHLRHEQPAVADRMIFVTGDVANEQTRSFLESENRPFVAKPFTIRDLRETLRGVLSRN